MLAWLARRAYAQKRNVLWDIAMSSHGVVGDHINDLRKNGYNKVDGVFVDVDPKVARNRARPGTAPTKRCFAVAREDREAAGCPPRSRRQSAQPQLRIQVAQRRGVRRPPPPVRQHRCL